ncbi:3-deoxy-D-manno-octulosonic acid kinase [Steroidobacter sp. S1-65]|uniref:3-deoxy-D-manno-octulosonic acid kinase n=1 Tax=Steroidobacter gossypii TaxID=2805490 RepID=A0ABS1X3U1_9GAMM|nr:3-deoxy-D-manno-octulosonic acid kinase [Steroidobacter gossypii]MBM0107894.1 3-deoxy-D-manno-octulosonic acid kinase [Steroidobacter gossypii]
MTDEQFIATAGGGILYDASRVSKPGAELFSRSQWAARGALEEIAGGRSSIALLNVAVWPGVEPGSNPPAADGGGTRWVLRHYRRGGFMAKLSRDSYVWSGAGRTRSFAEFRLLAELRRRGLPVPAPVAAHYARGLITYRADLITELLPGTRTLADSITGRDLPEAGWVAVGRTVAAFHRQGVHHADLNANNILLGSNGVDVYLLDFDRGRIEARGAWEQGVVARLRRSLEKIKGQRVDVRFGEQEWHWLHSALMLALTEEGPHPLAPSPDGRGGTKLS